MKVNLTSLIKTFKNKTLLLLPLLLCLASCSNSTQDHQPSYQVGSFLFPFSSANVTQFEIMKTTPDTGSQWIAEFKKNTSNTWTISSAPSGKSLVDQNANSGFINHFFDTLITLKATQKAPNGVLSSFGLSPPLVALRWKAQEKTHELHLGFPADPSQASAYARIPNDPLHQVFVVRGASLAMLARITDFKSLRQTRLETVNEDRIHTVEVYKQGQRIFTAKRISGQWADAKNTTYSKEKSKKITHWLKKITNLRVHQFIDIKEKSKDLFIAVKNQPAYKVKLKNPKGKVLAQISTAYLNNHLVGISDTRPNAAFLLEFTTLRYFEPPNSKLLMFNEKLPIL